MHRVHSVGSHISVGASVGASASASTSASASAGIGARGDDGVQWDLLIAGGRVVDPANSVDSVVDVAIRGGRIAAVAPNLSRSAAAEVFDATGLLVTPGLIDTHVHCFPGATTLGVPADEFCLGRGCTTVCDAGSAGPSTLAGFAEFVHDRCVLSVRHPVAAFKATGASVPHDHTPRTFAWTDGVVLVAWRPRWV